MEIAVDGAATVAGNSFYDQWDPSPAVGLFVLFPQKWSFFGGGLRIADYDASDPRLGDDPRLDFTGIFAFVTIGVQKQFNQQFTGRVGFAVGATEMLSGGGQGAATAAELEVTNELGISLAMKVSDRWSLFAASAINTVHTHTELQQVLVFVGASRSMSTPHWIRAVLR